MGTLQRNNLSGFAFQHYGYNTNKSNKMAFIQSFIAFLIKIFTYKQGASVLFSFCMAIVSTTIFTKLNDTFFKTADLKNVFLPIFIESVMIIFFLLIIMTDFYFGTRVAKKIKKEAFDWDRAVDTMAKVCAMIIITSMVMFLAIVSEAMDINWLWFFLTASLSVLWFLGIGFEFGSIGRHIESLTGSKPGMFVFFDKILIIIQKKAIQKVDSSFKIEEDEKDSNINNN
jgi:hypothetical protein